MKKSKTLRPTNVNTKLLFEIGAVICLKLLCLFFIWHAFFDTSTRIDQTPENVGNGILYRSTTLNNQPIGE